MATVDHTHFDGYFQGPSTLTKYAPGGDPVRGLDRGRWHEVGDDDLRTTSAVTQAAKAYRAKVEALKTEYVLGGGTTDYLFLVLAADHLLNQE
jgi:hypothetical protein